MTTISDKRIAAIEARREELQRQLSAGDLATERLIALSKEYSELEPVAAAAAELRRLRAEQAVLGDMLRDADPEIRQMAEEEAQVLRDALPDAEALRVEFAAPAPAALPALQFRTADLAGYDALRHLPDEPPTEAALA